MKDRHGFIYKVTRDRAPAVCACRKPSRHRDCSYCGTTALQPGRVCGVCREAGINGKLIPGTGRQVCRDHKQAKR